MIELKRIFPECDSDTLLVELILQRGNPGHRKGISKTVKAIIDHETNEFVVGVADTDKFKNDKNIPNLLKFSEVVENRKDEEGIVIWKIPGTNKYLIRIHPDFEPWIWKISQEHGVNSKDYSISSFDELYRLSKHYGTDQDSRFKKFVNAVIQKNPPPIQTLSMWMKKVLPTDDNDDQL